MSVDTRHPIVVVTGANSGVGFGICHRLLVQLCNPNPPDSVPNPEFRRFFPDKGTKGATYDGLTLILACRSVKRAAVARDQLVHLLEREVVKQKKRTDYNGHAERFQKNVHIQPHYIDLAIVRSIFEFGQTVRSKYPYVSHLVCNAGVTSFDGLDWPLAIWQLLTAPIEAVTAPRYNLQKVGEKGVDGLGWVWQCNVFGHYVLYRTLLDMLRRWSSSQPSHGMVFWMSSLTAFAEYYDPNDWQLLKNNRSYEASKYQIDLIAGQLQQERQGHIDHVLVQPGIVATNIAASATGWLMYYPMVLTFYLAKLLGSLNHVINPYKSAVSTTHFVLSPYALSGKAATTQTSDPVIKFSSLADLRGNESVGFLEAQDWDQSKAEGLLEKCNELYETVLKEEGP